MQTCLNVGGGLVTKSCLTLVTPWTVAKARILEWVAISLILGGAYYTNSGNDLKT